LNTWNYLYLSIAYLTYNFLVKSYSHDSAGLPMVDGYFYPVIGLGFASDMRKRLPRPALEGLNVLNDKEDIPLTN